jgi:hypothetical protein
MTGLRWGLIGASDIAATRVAAAVHAILGREPVEAAAVAVSQGPWDAAAEDAVVAALRYEGDVLVQTHDAYTVSHADTGSRSTAPRARSWQPE